MSMSEGSTAENGRALVWIVVVVSEGDALVCTRNRYQSLSWGLSIVSVESPKLETETLATMCLRTPLVESFEFRNVESAKKQRAFSWNRSGPMHASAWNTPRSALIQ